MEIDIKATVNAPVETVWKYWTEPEHIKVLETFEAESANSIEMQEAGWKAILDNFKRYSEGTNL